MNGLMWNVISAFGQLRGRGITIPVYARLKYADGERRFAGWIYRSIGGGEKLKPELQAGDAFRFDLVEFWNGTTKPKRSVSVKITWLKQPMFGSQIDGDSDARKFVVWFLNQKFRVAGSCAISTDQFRGREADWDLCTGDFYLVRCGTWNGEPKEP